MSKYPSAYGHTPSYRSVGSMPGSSVYPSALGARDSDLSFRSSALGASSLGSTLGSSGLSSDMDREFSSMKASMKADSLLANPLGLSTKTGGSSAYQSSSYSSKEVRSSADGGIPHRSTHSDSTYKSTATGNSGIPHTSYSSSSNSFDSDRPYGNRNSHFSYNI